jgi:hypothetical protein
MNDNPYQPPSVSLYSLKSEPNEKSEKVRSGQKLIIYGILLYFSGILLQFVIGPFAAILFIGTFALGIIGIIKLSNGFGYSVLSTVLVLIIMIIPVVGLIVLLIINSRATKYLTKNGYKVGLLGANKIN